MKKTIALSLFFHIFLFIAALLLSAHLPGGSRKGTHEKVFFVKLMEERGESRNSPSQKHEPHHSGKTTQTLIEKEKTKHQKSPLKKAAKTSLEPKRENTSPEKNTIEKGVEVLNGQEAGTQEEPVNNIVPTASTITDGITDIHYSQSTSYDYAYALPFPSVAGFSSSKGNDIVHHNTIEIIRFNIENAKAYPLTARKRGIEGTVYISFSIGPDGEPQELKILKGSGSRILDNATLDIVKRAAPFPHVESPVEVPVVFKLD
jgi:protein TonB